MSWRKCLVRGLVFTVLGGLGAAFWTYQYWTNPESIRLQVITQLEEHFVGAAVRLESARLQLLGGIQVNELRLVHRDGKDEAPLLYVPSAVIYHDKEKLLDGKLGIRRIDLYQPRIQVVHRADGSWNVAGVLGPVSPEEPIPTIVIHKGTLLFEDRQTAPGAAPVEVRNVGLTIVNDPLPTLVIHARGASDVLGPLKASGTWQRLSEAVHLAVEAPAASVGPSLVQRLAAFCPCTARHAGGLEGALAVRAELAYEPGTERPFRHHEWFRLTGGKWTHPDLPLPLEGLQAALECVDGEWKLEKLTARSGATRLEVKDGRASGARCDADLECKVKIDDLALNRKLFEGLPASIREIHDDFQPTGRADLTIEFGRRGGQWHRHSQVELKDTTACFVEFPYALEHIQGTIEHTVDPDRSADTCRLELSGMAGPQPVFIRGEVSGPLPRPAMQIDIWGADVALDEKLCRALPPKYRQLARSFHPSGQGDFVAQIRREAGRHETANYFKVRFHDCAIRYDVFPYPLENVSGVLEIFPEHWEFHDFKGSHKGGELQTHGRSHPNPAGDRVEINLSLSNLLIDPELEAALPPRLKAAWKSLAPGGRMSVTAQVDQLPDRPEDIAVAVTARGCTLHPDFFPYALTDVGGTVHYAHNKVDLGQFVARHGGSKLTLEKGEVFLKPTGGFYAKMSNLRGDPILPDQEFLRALPPTLGKACRALQVKDPLAVVAEDLRVDMPGEPNIPPVIYWDGGVGVHEATLQAGVELQHVSGQFWSRGRHNGRQLEGVVGNLMLEQATLFKQPLRQVHGHVVVRKDEPDVLRLPDLKAKVFGGDLGGEARVEFGPTIHYEVNLTATGIKLEEFGRHNQGAKADWSGQATSRLYLTGQGTDIQSLEGRGAVDIPNGRMYNLPLLLDLLKALALRPPDHTAFEEAHASFTIKGPRVNVGRLDLFGNAISLSGQGELNLDGSDLQLDFYAVWGRIVQLLPPLLKPLPAELGKQVLKVEMRGKLGDVRVAQRPVPFLTEPLERLLRRMNGSRGQEAGGRSQGTGGRDQASGVGNK